MSIVDSKHGHISDHLMLPMINMQKALFQRRVERYRRSAVVVNRFENILDWTIWGGEPLIADTVHFKEGTQGIIWRSINAVATTYECILPAPLNALGHHIEFWIYIDNIANFPGWRIMFDTLGGGWAKYFSFPAPAWPDTGWNKIVLNRNDFTRNGGAVDKDWGHITSIQIRVDSNLGATVNVTFDELLFVPDRFKAKCTLRFDDILPTQYSEARPRMDAYNMRGVLACVPDWVGPGAMTLTQLQLFEERGWDIIAHGLRHDVWTGMTPRQLHDDCVAVKTWLINNGFSKGSRFAAAPGHLWNNPALDVIKQYFVACQCMSGFYDQIPTGEPYRLSVQEVFAATPLATITGWIDKIIETNGWLTILIHTIVGGGSITPADFQSVLDYLHNNNVEVVTFSDVFDELIGNFEVDHNELLFYGVQGAITPNVTSYPCPGGGVAAQTANEIAMPINKRGWLKNLRVRQRVASGAGGRTEVYTIRVNGAATDLTCTLDNVLVGADLVNSVVVNPGDRVSTSLVSNNAGDTSADVEVSVELQIAR